MGQMLHMEWTQDRRHRTVRVRGTLTPSAIDLVRRAITTLGNRSLTIDLCGVRGPVDVLDDVLDELRSRVGDRGFRVIQPPAGPRMGHVPREVMRRPTPAV